METIGLGLALAALAGLPCAVTPDKACDAFYRSALSDVHVHRGQEGVSAAAEGRGYPERGDRRARVGAAPP